MRIIYKYNNIENFGIGNKTINNIDYTANASFESNDRVNTSMMVESLTSIINNAVNDVKQTNSSEAYALGASINTLVITGLSATNFILSGVDQIAGVKTNVDVDAAQKNVLTIINTLETNIQKQIIKNSNISDIINQINKNNENNLQASLDAIPKIPKVPKKKAQDQINALLGMGNTTTNNINVDYESYIKEILEIDDSFKVSDNNNIKNELLNTITNANYSTCKYEAIAQNAIALRNIGVTDTAQISNLSQTATIDTNIKCAFNQSSINNLSNKIVSQISTTINNLYKGIKNNPDPTKYNLLHYLSAAVSDKIIGSGEKIPDAFILPTQASQIAEQIALEIASKNKQNQQNNIRVTTTYKTNEQTSMCLCCLRLCC